MITTHENIGTAGGFMLSMITLDILHTPAVQTVILAALGATVSFLVSRIWGKIWVDKKSPKRPRR